VPYFPIYDLRTWVAQDDGQHVARAYSVEVVSTTVVIDRNARIAGIANPEQVTDEVLQRVLKGEPAGLPPWATRLIRPGEDPGAPSSGDKRPLFRLEIRFGDNPYRASLASGKGKFTADSVDAINLLINAFQISPTRILKRELLPSWHYTVFASAPEGNESLLRAMFQQALPAALGCARRARNGRVPAQAGAVVKFLHRRRHCFTRTGAEISGPRTRPCPP
jgi:hypothetical protein